MAAVDVAFEMGRVTREPGLSAEHVLHSLTAVVTRLVPGCCGASLAVWDAGRAVRSSVSHQDLAALRALPRPAAENPERQVMLSGDPVSIPDTRASGRWAGFSADAAAFGIGSVAIQPVTRRINATFGFYATRPQVFDGTELALIAAEAGVVLQDAEYHRELASDVHGLRAGREARSVIDQAIGIVMAERAWSPEDAFAEMLRLSQHGNVKLADLARQIVTRRSSS